MVNRRAAPSHGQRQRIVVKKIVNIVLTVIVGMSVWSSQPAACTAASQASRPIVFLPQWSPQAQFAGYFTAQTKGFYRQRGLSVTFLRGGPERPTGDHLTSGQADFVTLFLTEGLCLRDKGNAVVNIAQLVQRSALMLVARKSAGIQSPADFNGRRVSVWADFRWQPLAFFHQNHLDVNIVPQGYTLNLFLMGGVDAASAMWYNEYHTILNAGLDADELSTFMLADYGLNFPEDGIYCRLETLRREPETARAFVQASLAGWTYAFDHPDEAVDIVMDRVRAASLPTNRVHQQWMLARMQELIRPPGSPRPMGALSPDGFRFVAEKLHESGIIQTIPDFQEFHDPAPSAP